MTAEPWTVFSYPLHLYPFPWIVSELLGTEHLTSLTSDDPRWEAGIGDQSSIWHQLFYKRFSAMRPTYELFVYKVIAPIVGEPFYYQAIPTFRVHLPGNVAVGEFHTDAKYHHPANEETFWLPLTKAHDTSSVWVADDDDVLRSFDVLPGQMVRFSAVTRRHGNKINDTGKSRVSFDFRYLPVRCLPKDEGPPSENRKLRFIPGEYYARDIVMPEDM